MNADKPTWLDKEDIEPKPESWVVCFVAETAALEQEIANEIGIGFRGDTPKIITFTTREPSLKCTTYVLVFSTREASNKKLDEIQATDPAANHVTFTGTYTLDHLFESLGIRNY
ncbi:MAG: hypothetical protein AAB893_01315 [Patescibacteria group bacterium]